MSWFKGRETLKLFLISLWLIFTISFALWWLEFNLQNIAILARLEPGAQAHWDTQHRMIIWEGGSWVVLLALGGLALTFLVQRERRTNVRLREFFASFSHEIKTSLASLRVQAEALQDENINSPILDRLVGDTVRLALQLENSLFLASEQALELLRQELRLDAIVTRLREQWPGLTIELNRNCVLHGDERALRTVFSNLVQNSILHGDARTVRFVTSEASGGRLQIVITDNGKGIAVDKRAKLGTLFHRPTTTSGSGLGLYISRLLVRKMRGDIFFDETTQGFQARLVLEGGWV